MPTVPLTSEVYTGRRCSDADIPARVPNTRARHGNATRKRGTRERRMVAIVAYARVPNVPPVPIASVDPSVPLKYRVLLAVNVFPSAIVKGRTSCRSCYCQFVY